MTKPIFLKLDRRVGGGGGYVPRKNLYIFGADSIKRRIQDFFFSVIVLKKNKQIASWKKIPHI